MIQPEMTEDPWTLFKDDLTAEEASEVEASWDLYCRERKFDRSLLAGWIVTDMEQK